MLPSDRRRAVPAPRPPELAAARRYPLVATIAPVVVSIGLFALTRSPFTLVFALLGPVVAAATVADSALQRRRTASREAARFAGEVERARREIDEAHAAELAELDGRHPRAHSIAEETRGRAVRWRGSFGSDADRGLVRVGSGRTDSGVALDRVNSGPGDPGHSRILELQERAAVLDGAPITVAAHGGIGVVGPRVLARAAARGILVQLAAVHSPETVVIAGPSEADWDWLDGFPHAVTRGGPAGRIDLLDEAASARLAIAKSVSALPREVDVVLEVRADGSARVVQGSAGERPGVFRPEFMCLESATAAAGALRAIAERDGLEARGESLIPSSVALAQLSQSSAAGELSTAIGAGAEGPVTVDLVAQGPHAIVAGTTGSGKSELLVSWVLGMAAQRSPDVVTFLFVDFKGGAAFEPLAALPHSVGVITDLDAAQSLRAIASLGAELRHRERTLAARGLRSIDDPASGGAVPFPRLVIVVDEYAALVETHSSLHSVFADIAARGRSLGVHLVLCTQRPAGVVRDGILANCALRISLRVLTGADSTAVLGTDAAASLGSAPVGRALVAIAGAPPTPVQVAHAGPRDCASVAARWAGAGPPRVPWLPPLPNRIPIASLDGMQPDDSIPFAVADLPDEQSQRPARYRPDEHGSLLVVGAAGSGKSGLLAALAAAPSSTRVEWLPREVPQLWDALEAAVTASAGSERLLLLDDVDVVLASADDAYRDALRDRLSALVRAGRASGTHLALATQRVTGSIQALAGLCGSTIVLRMPNQQEHVLAGGAIADFQSDAAPGSAMWRGRRVQVFEAPRAAVAARALAAVNVDPASAGIVVVSTRPEEFAERMRALAPQRNIVVLQLSRLEYGGNVPSGSAGEPEIRVADPETWQLHWSALVAALRTGDVLFDGCSATDLRTLARTRDLPPPFPRGERPLWLLSREGRLTRARLHQPEGPRRGA